MFDVIKHFLNLDRAILKDEEIICEKALHYISKEINQPRIKKIERRRTVFNSVIFFSAFCKVDSFRKWIINVQFLDRKCGNWFIPLELLHKQNVCISEGQTQYNFFYTEESINFHIQLEIYTNEFLVDGIKIEDIINSIARSVFW